MRRRRHSVREISFNTIAHVGISLHSQGLGAPNSCSAVLVSGNFLDKLDNVMLFIKDITKQTQSVPFAVFLFRTSYKEPLKLSNELRLLKQV